VADRALVERGEPLMTLRIKIAHEVSRVDDIDDTQQMRRAEQEKLAIQTRSQMDYAREGRLRRHRRNI
jgi:plasmid rolling circle replication initiator protein Rep